MSEHRTFVIDTARMKLTPATAALVGLEMQNPDALGQALGAKVPEGWPPELLRDALPYFHDQLTAHPEQVGWLGWYGVAQPDTDSGKPTVAASGGFMGLPVDGGVEIGYSVLPHWQNCGYATEMMMALVGWAFAHSEVTCIAAEALPDNSASRRVLAKLGFAQNGTARAPGHLRFVLRRP